MSIIAKLDALQPPPPKPQKPTHHVLTFAEGLAIIRARRRGVGVRTIERETGLRYGAIYSKLGAWAMRFAAVPDCESSAEECSAPHRHTPSPRGDDEDYVSGQLVMRQAAEDAVMELNAEFQAKIPSLLGRATAAAPLQRAADVIRALQRAADVIRALQPKPKP